MPDEISGLGLARFLPLVPDPIHFPYPYIPDPHAALDHGILMPLPQSFIGDSVSVAACAVINNAVLQS